MRGHDGSTVMVFDNHYVPLLQRATMGPYEEKDKTTTRHVRNPPTYKCGYRSKLANPPTGLDYTPVWCYPILISVILHKRLYLLL
jgi:hypothetical protein